MLYNQETCKWSHVFTATCCRPWGWNTRLARFAAHTAAGVMPLGEKHVPRQKKLDGRRVDGTIDLLRFFWIFFLIFPPKEMKLRFFETGDQIEDIEWFVGLDLGRWPGPRTSFVGVWTKRWSVWGMLNFYWFVAFDLLQNTLVPNFVGMWGIIFLVSLRLPLIAAETASQPKTWPAGQLFDQTFTDRHLENSFLEIQQLIVLCFTCAVDSLKATKATQTKLMHHTSWKICTSF